MAFQRARRPQRGFFSHSDKANEVNVTFDVPDITGIDVDWSKIIDKVGQAEAAKIRKALKSGHTPTGEPLPAPLPLRATAPAGRPLQRTGELIDSIKYRKQAGMISPSTNRRSDVSNRAKSNFGLLAIHHSGVYVSKHRGVGAASNAMARRGQFDALGSQDPKLEERLNAEVQKQLEKQRKIELKARNPPVAKRIAKPTIH